MLSILLERMQTERHVIKTFGTIAETLWDSMEYASEVNKG